ncbi:Cof subfamily protein (haloacid dehalogenase superfamily) [Oikeobacillus pervagus]|uniref:Cof subfamily protein (Haloacid dehalogenase superfamily) n=1 Tax=Oikeobacillus pervagus TaxID=1325931 RepID=A0AAJ1T7R8_9BACI|nr:Cof-type HAD-IIB family hydrolase [Oikeobacillus pervagus]MDQ0216696.1 Cof subfamily protein (haloacid dehalogenase superfamily) [Oikeobacillus pervagus]
MTEKHLIVLDLDGTLLKDDKTISQNTMQTLQKAKEKGHEVMIATGRPYRSSATYYQQLQLTTPIVNFNGAFVHHPKDSSWKIHHTPMDIRTAKEIVDACHDFDFFNIIAEVLDDVYFHYHDERLLNIFGFGTPLITTGDLRKSLEKNPTSLLIHAEEQQVDQIRQHLNHVHAEVIDHRRWAAPWHVIEIVRTGLNKAVGIQKVSKHLNIPRERIIAFGDEDNDLEMIDYAGIGVAMGNGIDELKTIANEITKTNEEDGIAHFLKDRLSL